MIEAFKEDISNSLKEIQENTIKQVETLKKEANPLKTYRKTQWNRWGMEDTIDKFDISVKENSNVKSF
jgi:ribosomal protein L23